MNFTSPKLLIVSVTYGMFGHGADGFDIQDLSYCLKKTKKCIIRSYFSDKL